MVWERWLLHENFHLALISAMHFVPYNLWCRATL